MHKTSVFTTDYMCIDSNTLNLTSCLCVHTDKYMYKQSCFAKQWGYLLRNVSGDFVIVGTSQSTLTQNDIACYTPRLYDDSLLLLGYKSVQYVTVLSTASNYNTMVNICVFKHI